MKLITYLKNRRTLIITVLILILLASGIISPILINQRKNNWAKILTEKIYTSENIIKSSFDKKIEDLLGLNNDIKSGLKDNQNYDVTIILEEILKRNEDDNKQIQIFDSDCNLVFWNGDEIYEKNEINTLKNYIGQAKFKTRKLKTYISVFDSIKTKNKIYYCVAAIPVEDKYNSIKHENKLSSYTDYFSNLIKTSVRINYDSNARKSGDGRIHSFNLLNNYNKKIGIVEFEKPSLDNEILQLENILNYIQSILLILIYLSVAWVVYQKVKHKQNIVRFTVLLIFIALFRIIMFETGIPSSFVANDLTDATNFSSTFAFGIVRSPLEFSITASLGFYLIIVGFKNYLKYFDLKKTKSENWFSFLLVLVAGYLLILLFLRGLGASLRSVVFDSSIRYFKEFILIPDAATFLMDFNILLVGISVFIICIVLLMAIYSYIPLLPKKKTLLLYMLMFIALQIAGYVFDSIQKQPQGTPMIRAFFITVIFILGYLLIFRNYRSTIKYLYIAFGASIATVSLLTYYNSEIERESIKTTAQELTRSNINIYQFMIHQTVSAIQNDNDIQKLLAVKKEMSPAAFVEWTKSLLYRENIPAAITFYDVDKKVNGSFSNTVFDEGIISISQNVEINDSPSIEVNPNVYNGKTIIEGIAAVKYEDLIVGYVSVSVLYDENYINFVDAYPGLSIEKSGLSSALNAERLKIFFFRNDLLEKSIGQVQLSDYDIRKVTGTKFTKHNEAWLRIKIAGENYLFYLFKIESDESKIIAVAKEEKSFAWNLSDFFKVFFVHTGLIILAFIIIVIVNYKKINEFLSSYKTKLAAAFIVVSAVPLIVIAAYFKILTDEKNTELIFNSLDETAVQIDNYLNMYLTDSPAQIDVVFKKAAEDLDVNYNIYNDKIVFYSSTPDYYKAGLFNTLLPFEAWEDLYKSRLQKSFISSSTVNDNRYSVFINSKAGGKDFVIEVNSHFNKTSVPLSDIDINIFMFGVFSLALILLFVFSTVLAEQISYPIRKLTKATRSLGGGDLNIEISGKYSGEIAELINGFNMMVKRLHKSQVEMAQLERETAWKEMAKQVAHEIKNPLTPMKLSVQQLITAYKDKSPKFDGIFEKVTSTIITQIETLKNIASEFSNFARMPKLNIEKINLIDSVKETINLFIDEKLKIKYSSSTEVIYVNADHDHLNRTFVNLIRNSIQASANNILINIEQENNTCIVSVTDDGQGIPPESIGKIFDENYTTKSTGMGLGLSMAKKFLEGINGNIEVKESSKEGTTFRITIPVAL